jgi:hypothetical protein
VETKPVKILDYENVVGQDSLTRLDERRNQNNKKKNKNRNKNQRPGGQAEGGAPRPDNAGQAPQAPRTQEARPEGGNPNRNKNFRPNRNNQNRPGNPGPDANRDRNKGDQSGKKE